MSKRKIRMAKYYLCWAVVYAFITLMATAPTLLVAAWLLPEMERRRGQFAVGGE